jgi:hypothetical protein
MTIPETQARPRQTKGATDVQADAPRKRLLFKSAGAYLGVSYWTVRDLVFNGILPSVKIPRDGDGQYIRRIPHRPARPACVHRKKQRTGRVEKLVLVAHVV